MSKKFIKFVLLIGFFLPATFLFPSPTTYAFQRGDQIPEIESYSLEGLPVSFQPEEGKLLLILFVNLNQAESLQDMKNSIILYNRFHDKGLNVAGVSLSSSEDTIEAFLKKWMIPWPQLKDDEENPPLSQQLQIKETPANLLVDSNRKVLAVNLGIISETAPAVPEVDVNSRSTGENAHQKIAEILKVSLTDLPLPPEPTPRTKNQNRPGGISIEEAGGGFLIRSITQEFSTSMFGSPAERKQMEENKKKFRVISLALKRYRSDHDGAMPDHLSDLIPNYIKDATVFLDPINPVAQISMPELGDPKVPCSFLYEFAKVSAGGHDNYQEWKKEQMKEYGDRVPVVRHFFVQTRALNLSYGGEIYFSDTMWEEENPTSKTLDDSVCKIHQQLLHIAVALDDYKKDHSEVPNGLADLIPQYLPDESAIRNPVTKEAFSYQFSPNGESPVATQNQRQWKLSQVKTYGDYVPIVRVHYVLPNGRVINLSYGGEIWESDLIWENNLKADSTGTTSVRHTYQTSKAVQKGQEAAAIQERNWSSKPIQGTIAIQNDEQMVPVKGQWRIEGRKFQQMIPTMERTVLLFEPVVKKGEIRLRARTLQGDECVRIVFGFTSPDETLYTLDIGGMGIAGIIRQWNSLYGNRQSEMYFSKPFKFDPKEWHDVRVQVDSEKKTVYGFVDDQKVMDWELDTLSPGRLGIGTQLSTAEFEQISIEGN